MNELQTTDTRIVRYEDKLEQAKQTASNAWSVNTHRAYDLGWQQWERWCAENQQTALPAALRRSELVGLDISAEQSDGSTGYITLEERGMLVTLTSSKTDKEGAGQQIAVPYTYSVYCAVRALQAWLEASDITEGALFRRLCKGDSAAHRAVLTASRLSSQSARMIVMQRCVAAGVAEGAFKRDSAGFERLVSARLIGSDTAVSAHSLRSGFITSAAAAEVSLPAIQRQSRHKSLSVLMEYVREYEAWSENALSKVGL